MPPAPSTTSLGTPSEEDVSDTQENPVYDGSRSL